MTAAIPEKEQGSIRDCAVWISTDGAFQGSGFIACPGIVVTAAHVLRRAGQLASDIRVEQGVEGFDVKEGQVRLEPVAFSEIDGFHPFPDLAVLSVPQLAQHAGVVLSTMEAAAGDEVTAFGYSDATPSPGVRLETLALRVAGPSGDFIRVLGDGVREGFSGSMVVGANGLVHGIVKASRSYANDKGGWYVPTAPLIKMLGAAARYDRTQVAINSPTDADLVDALMKFSAMARPEIRLDLLEMMGERLGLPHSFEVEDRSDRRDHLYRIIRRCRHHRDAEGALKALLSGMEQIAPHDVSLSHLRSLIECIVGSGEK
ncbi:trypsin-like peptidase domain-containing protein [Streptomyces sp. NPDC079167]|uniref:effector-associated domain 2-containing protein n=1 Tax=Streptomyces sp. NPDC079167 TaxID=3154513 RepID=UPI003417EFC8